MNKLCKKIDNKGGGEIERARGEEGGGRRCGRQESGDSGASLAAIIFENLSFLSLTRPDLILAG